MRRLAASSLALLLLSAAVPVTMAAEPPRLERRGDDQIQPLVPPDGGAMSAQAVDPLGLLPRIDILQTHSLGTDVIDVWDCGVPDATAASIVGDLDSTVVPYFAAHSRGRLQLDFVPRGSAPTDTCGDVAFGSPSASANGVLLVSPGEGGYATPGYYGLTSFPQNQRYAVVGFDWVFPMVTAHELGHTQAWPHVDSEDLDLYDNPLDLMSGNQGPGGTGDETDLPYGTAAINRYAAGWIDPEQVRILTGQAATFKLEPSSSAGLQMAVIMDGDRYITLGARTRSTYDPIPSSWQGVEVNEVVPCPVDDLATCVNGYDGAFGMGFRQVYPYGREPYLPGTTPAHLIRPGTSKTVLDRTVSVTAVTGGYEVTVSSGAGLSFIDTGTSSFQDDIEWLAAEGITRGCNPPLNDRFCPDSPVTRGQMAAFLHRALSDLPTKVDPIEFIDTASSTFRLDIDWLSATDITRGCNPPTNDRFCPDNPVTRGQMAAFLHRALPDLPVGTPLSFTDTAASSFRLDIEWLSATGITRGCNPPVNDRFCPGNAVTRGQMAAFLRRALED